MKNGRSVWGAFLLLIGTVIAVPAASLPRTISYQGYLKDGLGRPVNAPAKITFSFYSSNPARNNPVWRESQAVTVKNGVYDVLLGSTVPFTVTFDVPYYLGLKVGGDPEMTPLQPLSTVGYAVRSVYADRVGDLSVGTAALADGAVTAAKLDTAYVRTQGDSMSGPLTSTVPTGTAPLAVASNTLIPNLNADLLDGQHAVDIAATAATSCGTAVATLQTQLAEIRSFILSSSAFALQWRTPQLVETESQFTSHYHHLAMNSGGSAMAVWAQLEGTRDDIWASRYVVGIGWGMPQLIETNSGVAYMPKVALDSDGNAVAVWVQSDGSLFRVWANRYTPATGWGSAQIIEDKLNTGDAYDADVAMDRSGNALAVWLKHDGTRYRTWANHYQTGTGWGTAQLIEGAASGDSVTPHVAMDAGGNGIAVWSQQDSIWSNRYIAGTGWGAAQTIETSTISAGFPQVAMNADGTAFAVWQQSEPTRAHIWANRFSPSLGWGKPQLVESNKLWYPREPQVAVDAAGNAAVVWYVLEGVTYNIWSNRFAVGSGWGSEQLIENGTGDATYPRIAADGNGVFTAVWQQFNPATMYDVMANRYIPGSGWWGQPQVISSGGKGAYYPLVAADSNGGFMAVWSQYDGTNYHIWSNRFSR